MEDHIGKYSFLSSLFWKLMERSGTQIIQFIVRIILARILLPDDYGILSLIIIFITIANVIVQSGFNIALIQKKDIDDAEYSSVFYISMLVAGLLYMVLFLLAPLIAYIYKNNLLISVIRVLSITLFLGAFSLIQNAVMAKRMEFKKLFFSSLGGILASGTIGILMAYSGFGVWALVFQQLTNQFIVNAILWFTVNWRPKLIFSLEKLKGLLSYGWKLLVSSFIDTIYVNLQGMFICKIYNPAMLGYFDRGELFPQVIVSNINGSIQAVIFPTLALVQDNRQRVKEIVKRSIVTSSFVIFPMMAGLIVIAEPLVRILLTDKWLPSVPFLQIACLYYALFPIHTTNLQAINVLGRSDIYLKLEIVKIIVGCSILCITVPMGVYAIALGLLANGIIAVFINAFPNLKLINYGCGEQCKDILPSLLISLVMGITIYCFKLFYLSTVLTVILQVCAGVILYTGLAKLFRLECYNYLISTIKEIVINKKDKGKEISNIMVT